MAQVENPLIGNTRGKFATATFWTMWDKRFIRSRPAQYRRPQTSVRDNQESKFKQIVNVTTALLKFIRLGFSIFPAASSAYSKCISYNMLNSVSYNDDHFQLLIDSFHISIGDLPEPDHFTNCIQVNNIFNLSRAPVISVFPGQDDDNNFIILFDSLTGNIFEPDSIVNRTATSTSIITQNITSPDTVYLFQFCTSTNLQQISNSICIPLSSII
jgi:hypothetical protein